MNWVDRPHSPSPSSEMAVTALFLPKLCLKSPGASREVEREVGGGREVWEEPWRTNNCTLSFSQSGQLLTWRDEWECKTAGRVVL